jgi:hypothetical protein
MVMELEKMNKMVEVVADKFVEENKDWVMKMKLNNAEGIVGGSNDWATQWFVAPKYELCCG